MDPCLSCTRIDRQMQCCTCKPGSRVCDYCLSPSQRTDWPCPKCAFTVFNLRNHCLCDFKDIVQCEYCTNFIKAGAVKKIIDHVAEKRDTITGTSDNDNTGNDNNSGENEEERARREAQDNDDDSKFDV
jgi:hypothetical protein